MRLAIDHALDALDDLVPYQVNRRTGVDGGVVIYRHIGTDTASGVDETDGAKGARIIKHLRVFLRNHPTHAIAIIELLIVRFLYQTFPVYAHIGQRLLTQHTGGTAVTAVEMHLQ